MAQTQGTGQALPEPMPSPVAGPRAPLDTEELPAYWRTGGYCPSATLEGHKDPRLQKRRLKIKFSDKCQENDPFSEPGFLGKVFFPGRGVVHIRTRKTSVITSQNLLNLTPPFC